MPLPTLFISHGSPEFALAPEQLGAALTRLGQELPRPRAVLVLSPHWMTRRLEVQSAAKPETVHDFGGFSPALYDLHYDAPGAPDVAAEVLALLEKSGSSAIANEGAGRDHGAWVPLLHLYPMADVPVLQLSQLVASSPERMLALGAALEPLRHQGVLIVGSGSLTHNLHDFRSGAGVDYVPVFADWVAEHLAAGDLPSLRDYRTSAPYATRAHPTDEHFLPLFFAIGAAGSAWATPQRLTGGISERVLAMDSFVFGASLHSGSSDV